MGEIANTVIRYLLLSRPVFCYMICPPTLFIKVPILYNCMEAFNISPNVLPGRRVARSAGLHTRNCILGYSTTQIDLHFSIFNGLNL